MVPFPLRRLFSYSLLISTFALPRVEATLLTAGYESQLEAWLGEGNLSFTNIFTSVAGDGQTGYDFHAAVDGQGRTFTLIDVTTIWAYDYEWNFLPTAGEDQVLGGYNPQSWVSSNNYTYTYSNAERTAFIFNLTTGLKQAQNLIGQGSPYFDTGSYQTHGHEYEGPAFGAGYDLGVDGSLANGYARNWSYGGTSDWDAITSDNGMYVGFLVKSVEIYTIAPASPAPAVAEGGHTLALVALSVVGLGTLRRARVRR